jgi:hypothetical protein
VSVSTRTEIPGIAELTGLLVSVAVNVNLPAKPGGHPVVLVTVRMLDVIGMKVTYEFTLKPRESVEAIPGIARRMNANTPTDTICL